MREFNRTNGSIVGWLFWANFGKTDEKRPKNQLGLNHRSRSSVGQMPIIQILLASPTHPSPPMNRGYF